MLRVLTVILPFLLLLHGTANFALGVVNCNFIFQKNLKKTRNNHTEVKILETVFIEELPTDSVLDSLPGSKIRISKTHNLGNKIDNPEVQEGWVVFHHGEKITVITQNGHFFSIDFFNTIHGTKFKLEILEKEDSTILIASDQWITYAKNHPNEFIYVTSLNNDALVGTLNFKKLGNFYEVITIQDTSGKIHTLDPFLHQLSMKVIKSNSLRENLSKAKTNHLVNEAALDGDSARTLANLVKKMDKLYDNSKIYDYFDKHNSYITALIKKWYGEESANKYISLIDQTIGQSYRSLLFDPGIVIHLNSFKKFVESMSVNESMSSFEVRDLFSKYLDSIYNGPKKLYRALFLSELEAKDLDRSGRSKATFDENLFNRLLINYFLTNPEPSHLIPHSPSDHIDMRIGRLGDLGKSLFLSASLHPEVATSAAYHSNDQVETIKQEGNKKLYLLEVEVPNISVLTKQIYQKSTRSDGFDFFIKGKQYPMIEVEVFLPFKITENQITSIKEIESEPPPYVFKKQND